MAERCPLRCFEGDDKKVDTKIVFPFQELTYPLSFYQTYCKAIARLLHSTWEIKGRGHQ
jgi:hypothetical protein